MADEPVPADGIILRSMGAGDGPAIAALDEASPDTGAISFSTRYLFDPYAAFAALHPGALGVVAVASGHDGIVGMGAMSLGRAAWRGVERGYAYLFSIGVHPEHRRRGVASVMYDWLIGGARERLGPDCVIVAGMQEQNVGSVRAAQRWCTYLERRTSTLLSTMRRRPPRSAGFTVREAGEDEWDAIARRQNAFYAGHDLYPLRDGEALGKLHAAAPFGIRFRRYFVAVEPSGTIVAGMSVTEEGALEPLAIRRIPLFFRAADALLHVLPPDGLLRRLPVRDLWFAPGRSQALRILWETVRWLMRDRGTLLMAFVDPRGPLSRVIPATPFVPTAGGYLAIAAPEAPSVDRPIYHHT